MVLWAEPKTSACLQRISGQKIINILWSNPRGKAIWPCWIRVLNIIFQRKQVLWYQEEKQKCQKTFISRGIWFMIAEDLDVIYCIFLVIRNRSSLNNWCIWPLTATEGFHCISLEGRRVNKIYYSSSVYFTPPASWQVFHFYSEKQLLPRLKVHSHSEIDLILHCRFENYYSPSQIRMKSDLKISAKYGKTDLNFSMHWKQQRP